MAKNIKEIRYLDISNHPNDPVPGNFILEVHFNDDAKHYTIGWLNTHFPDDAIDQILPGKAQLHSFPKAQTRFLAFQIRDLSDPAIIKRIKDANLSGEDRKFFATQKQEQEALKKRFNTDSLPEALMKNFLAALIEKGELTEAEAQQQFQQVFAATNKQSTGNQFRVTDAYSDDDGPPVEGFFAIEYYKPNLSEDVLGALTRTIPGINSSILNEDGFSSAVVDYSHPETKRKLEETKLSDDRRKELQAASAGQSNLKRALDTDNTQLACAALALTILINAGEISQPDAVAALDDMSGEHDSQELLRKSAGFLEKQQLRNRALH